MTRPKPCPVTTNMVTREFERAAEYLATIPMDRRAAKKDRIRAAMMRVMTALDADELHKPKPPSATLHRLEASLVHERIVNRVLKALQQCQSEAELVAVIERELVPINAVRKADEGAYMRIVRARYARECELLGRKAGAK